MLVAEQQAALDSLLLSSSRTMQAPLLPMTTRQPLSLAPLVGFVPLERLPSQLVPYADVGRYLAGIVIVRPLAWCDRMSMVSLALCYGRANEPTIV